jgi:hypothetical protein
VVERLGPDDGEILFQGTFSGPDAEIRVRAFDNLRLSGDIVWLTWESFRRQVVVKSFVVEYHSPSWIKYRVTCVVVYQEGVVASALSPIAALIFADLGNALSAGSGLPVELTSLQLAFSDTNALTDGTSDKTKAEDAVRVGLAAMDGQIAQQSALIMAAGAEPPTEPSEYRSAFASTVSSAGSLAAAVNARSYIGRIGVNLNGSGS